MGFAPTDVWLEEEEEECSAHSRLKCTSQCEGGLVHLALALCKRETHFAEPSPSLPLSEPAGQEELRFDEYPVAILQNNHVSKFHWYSETLSSCK